jgi:hypothetical protein
MARQAAVFGDGVIQETPTTLVTVPSGQRWYVTRLDCYNTSQAQDVDVVFYLLTGSQSREWKRGTLDRDGGHCEVVTEKALILEAGDSILARASVANVVTFYCGGVRDA